MTQLQSELQQCHVQLRANDEFIFSQCEQLEGLQEKNKELEDENRRLQRRLLQVQREVQDMQGLQRSLHWQKSEIEELQSSIANHSFLLAVKKLELQHEKDKLKMIILHCRIT